jgi:hypothetical protein
MRKQLEQLSLQDFKRLYSYQVFTNHMGKNPSIGKAILSPLREEKNPSFSVYKDETTGEYLFKDFGSNDSGDCIRFVELKQRLDFKAVIDLLQAEFNCNISEKPFSVQYVAPKGVTEKVVKPHIHDSTPVLKTRTKFTAQEADFFKQYRITPETVKTFNVAAVDAFTTNNGKEFKRGENELIFCYNHGKWVKIYKPNSKDKKHRFIHLGKKPSDFIFGYEQLPPNSDQLIITGGEKDVLTLSSLGYLAIALNSETSNLSQSKANELKSRFKNIFVLYDTDETGKYASEKLCSEHGFKQASLPFQLFSIADKDISDYVKAGYDKKELEIILSEAIQFNKTEPPNLLKVLPANTWINESKNKPVPKMLFDVFWFEGELCILFSDTNMGKSILAVQIADSISRGVPVPGFKLDAESQSVLYLDFELSDKQFEARYSIEYTDHYAFNSSLYRAEINPDTTLPPGFTTFETFLHYSLEQHIINTGCKIIIIDNITYLRSETEKAREALPLMKELKALKNKYQLSILALAHTPKRDLTKPISRNDLQGSKMLINFCDSAFAIGESQQDKSLRYLKQIKARNTDIIFDTENIAVCGLEKPDNFLQFRFTDFANERNHLKVRSEKELAELETAVINLKTDKPHLSYQEISDQLGTYKVKVGRILKKAGIA